MLGWMRGFVKSPWALLLFGLIVAALVFGPLFFPSSSETAQTLLAFMSFGVAFIARPFGAVAFGHFFGREQFVHGTCFPAGMGERRSRRV